jgi:hypothetical protein
MVFVCRCGKVLELDTQGWRPTEPEPWMCPDCRKRYMEFCERQIDECDHEGTGHVHEHD